MARLIEASQISADQLTRYEISLVSTISTWIGYTPLEKHDYPEYKGKSSAEICHQLGDQLLKADAVHIRKMLIARSYFRKNKKLPPICLICYNSDTNSVKRLGPLRWLTNFPDFFAFHELCVKCSPKVVMPLEVNLNLERVCFYVDIKSLLSEFGRARKNIGLLGCGFCGMNGALNGCYCNIEHHDCHKTFHLPCALRNGAFISYAPNNEFLLCNPEGNERHIKMAFQRQKTTLDELSKLGTSEKNRAEFRSKCARSTSMKCRFCKENVDFDPAKIMLNKVVMAACCGFTAYHYSCMQNHFITDPYLERICPECRKDNDTTQFPKQMHFQGIFARDQSTEDGDRSENDSKYHTSCHLGKDCLCPKGPYYYDVHDLDADVFYDWEPLNSCPRCTRNCHRRCGGGVYASVIDNPEDDDLSEDPVWYCDPCREYTDKKAARKSIEASPKGEHSDTTADTAPLSKKQANVPNMDTGTFLFEEKTIQEAPHPGHKNLKRCMPAKKNSDGDNPNPKLKKTADTNDNELSCSSLLPLVNSKAPYSMSPPRMIPDPVTDENITDDGLTPRKRAELEARYRLLNITVVDLYRRCNELMEIVNGTPLEITGKQRMYDILGKLPSPR